MQIEVGPRSGRIDDGFPFATCHDSSKVVARMIDAHCTGS